jgi:lipoate-protein ligase A
MHYLDLTLTDAAENLALDEALLDEAESADRPVETLRLWEPAQAMVVVGRSSRVRDEVQVDVCRRQGVPVLRRSSGGAAIVTGPGCLMYALVLSYQARPALRAVDRAHQYVLDTIAAALRPLAADVACRGISDLAVGNLKFSGNSVRCKQNCLLYHGTLLYDFPLELVERYLAMPARQPDYRGGRPHPAFVANLRLPVQSLRAALVAAWQATEPYGPCPRERMLQLVSERYGQREWNERI